VIVVNQDGAADADILSVNWSPQFEAPLHINPSEAAQFYEAYRCNKLAFDVDWLFVHSKFAALCF
jgi:hypothetical protein